MALLADGNPSQITDLANYESAIVEVAAIEGIDLTAKATVAAKSHLNPIFLQHGKIESAKKRQP